MQAIVLFGATEVTLKNKGENEQYQPTAKHKHAKFM